MNNTCTRCGFPLGTDAHLTAILNDANTPPSLVAASREAMIDRVHRALWGQRLSDDEWPTIRDQHGPTVGGIEAERITDALLAGPVQLADVTPEQAWRDCVQWIAVTYNDTDVAYGVIDQANAANPYVGNSRKEQNDDK